MVLGPVKQGSAGQAKTKPGGPTAAPSLLLFKAADLDGESGAFIGAADMVARKAALAKMQAGELKGFQGGQPGSRSPPGEPEAVEVSPVESRASPGAGGVLDQRAWVARFHPEVAKQSIITRDTFRQMNSEYESYVGRQQFNRRFPPEGEAGRLRPRDIPGRPAGQLGLAVLTGQKEEIIKRLEQLVTQVHGPAAGQAVAAGKSIKGKNKLPISTKVRDRALEAMAAGDYDNKDVRFLLRAYGVAPKKTDPAAELANAAIAELVAGGKPGPATRALRRFKGLGKGPSATQDRGLQEQVFGFKGVIPGLLQKIQEDPVGGWLEAYRTLTNFSGFAHPAQADQIKTFLANNAPTLEQVQEAEAAGKLTPEDKGMILSVILSPEEQRAALGPRPAAQPAARTNRTMGSTFPKY